MPCANPRYTRRLNCFSYFCQPWEPLKNDLAVARYWIGAKKTGSPKMWRTPLLDPISFQPQRISFQPQMLANLRIVKCVYQREVEGKIKWMATYCTLRHETHPFICQIHAGDYLEIIWCNRQFHIWRNVRIMLSLGQRIVWTIIKVISGCLAFAMKPSDTPDAKKLSFYPQNGGKRTK